MSIIDFRDARPIYEQIASYYESLILKGILQEDEQMPSVRSLSMELSTNPNTVQKAYSQMEADGYVYSVKGRGSFVKGADDLRDNKLKEIKKEILTLLKEAAELGIDTKKLSEDIKTAL